MRRTITGLLTDVNQVVRRLMMRSVRFAPAQDTKRAKHKRNSTRHVNINTATINCYFCPISSINSVFALRLQLPSFRTSDQPWGHIEGTSFPPYYGVRAFIFIASKSSALSSFVDSRRIVHTHVARRYLGYICVRKIVIK